MDCSGDGDGVPLNCDVSYCHSSLDILSKKREFVIVFCIIIDAKIPLQHAQRLFPTH